MSYEQSRAPTRGRCESNRRRDAGASSEAFGSWWPVGLPAGSVSLEHQIDAAADAGVSGRYDPDKVAAGRQVTGLGEAALCAAADGGWRDGRRPRGHRHRFGL